MVHPLLAVDMGTQHPGGASSAPGLSVGMGPSGEQDPVSSLGPKLFQPPTLSCYLRSLPLKIRKTI